MNIQKLHQQIETSSARNKGQVLLFAALAAAVILTFSLSVAHISTQEIKSAKLEEDSKRAYAAAEAGVEAAMRLASGSLDLATLNLGSDITGSAVITFEIKQIYRTPLLSKDEQLTFYLSNYTPPDPDDPNSNQQFGPAYSGRMQILRVEPSGNYCGNSNTKFAVELTFINVNTNSTTHRLIDECNLVTGSSGKIPFGVDFDVSAFPSHILLLRIIAPENSFVGAKMDIVNSIGQWPAQGKTITSTANIATGVTKKLRVFQSFPQIPADFFVTSF